MEVFQISNSNLLVVAFFLSTFTFTCHSFTSFVFGDSLVDAGNNNYIFTLSKADLPPYGIDFEASGGQPTGRFTNGRTISDIVGQSLGAASFPPPFLAPNTKNEAVIQRGINYASGASGILDETGFIFLGRIPLRVQVNNFEETRAYLVQTKGENETNALLKKAIFSLTIGSNDVLNSIQPSIPFFTDYEAKDFSTIHQEAMISNLTLNLKNCSTQSIREWSNISFPENHLNTLDWAVRFYSRRLHKLGARKFVVVGIGPLGCIPFVRALKLQPSGECSAEVNSLIQGYNKKLRKMLHQLNQELSPEAIFIYANSYDIVMKIIANFRHYGFENANEPCCGGYFLPFVCLKNQNENSSSSLCEDRSKFVFWDAYHPTEATNLIIANELINGDPSIVFPINILQLSNYLS